MQWMTHRGANIAIRNATGKQSFPEIVSVQGDR
jgi:hypothetical protein